MAASVLRGLTLMAAPSRRLGERSVNRANQKGQAVNFDLGGKLAIVTGGSRGIGP